MAGCRAHCSEPFVSTATVLHCTKLNPAVEHFEVSSKRAVTNKLRGAQDALRERMAGDIAQLQRRLLARDAAAKKYKDGCRALKAQVEALEADAANLAQQNTALRERPASTDAREEAERSAERERAKRKQAAREKELRALLLRAQDDVAASRELCASAEAEARTLSDKACPRLYSSCIFVTCAPSCQSRQTHGAHHELEVVHSTW
jgi:predicted RNase H-like nuclease (RuvC/YqgF family)